MMQAIAMTRQELLAAAVLNARDIIKLFVHGFDGKTRVAQAAHLPNHLAWSLGHITIVFHELAEHLDGKGLPETDFAAPDIISAGNMRFIPSSVEYTSIPVADTSKYPTIVRCVEALDAAAERLANALRHADDIDLEHRIPWGDRERPIWSVALSVFFHAGFHTGQIADMRRALGFSRIFDSDD